MKILLTATLGTVLAATAFGEGNNSDGWIKKVKSYPYGSVVSMATGSSYGTNSAYSDISYQYFLDHKLVAYISKDDELYKLYDGKDAFIAKYDELNAAKEAGAKLGQPASITIYNNRSGTITSPCYVSPFPATVTPASK